MFKTLVKSTRAVTLFTASFSVAACPKRRPKQSNPESGEDAYFTRRTSEYFTAGVFDGVGGWADSGVDPSIFSTGLARHCKQVKSSDPLEILTGGYEAVQRDAEIKMGSSTACVATIALATAMLKVANLGDSGYLITDSRGNVTYESKPQIYFFNAPYQLAKMPDSMRRPGSLENKPADADVTSHDMRDGGKLILATDGFFDNVFSSDAERIIKSKPADLAQALVKEAVNNGRSRNDGPFAAEARRHRLRYHGGKEDDVVVVVVSIDPLKAKL